MSGRYGYVLFHTSAAAFRAEKAVRESCASASDTLSGARLVPTPRALSSDCGVSLRFDLAGTDDGGAERAMRVLLDERGIPFDRIAEA